MTRRRRHGGADADPKMPPWWETVVILVTIAGIVIVVADWALESNPMLEAALEWADLGVCALFWTDFGVRMSRAPDRLGFARRNWLDLVGAIPLVGPLRAARVVRFIRIVRLTRIAVLFRRLTRGDDLQAPGDTIASIGVLVLLAWIGSAALFYFFEVDHNPGVSTFEDALWWGMTTLSTVGYGDVYPRTSAGRLVALLTMVLGIGTLGTFAAAIASFFIDLRERGRRGLRSYVMQDHLLVLGWNPKASVAIRELRADPRFEDATVVIVADRESTPHEGKGVLFVRGQPGRREALERAGASGARGAIVLAADPSDPRSDHQTALAVLALRAINKNIRISAELVDSENAEHLVHAGCDAVIDPATLASSLLARSVQDAGVPQVLERLLGCEQGPEMYRVPVAASFVGRTYRELAIDMIEKRSALIGLARGGENILNPPGHTPIVAGDEAYIVASELPSA